MVCFGQHTYLNFLPFVSEYEKEEDQNGQLDDND